MNNRATFLQKIQQIILNNLDNSSLSADTLPHHIGYSQSKLYRYLKATTGLSPAIYIRNVRLQKGKELLIQSDLNVSEVSYSVGFLDPAYFSRVFSKRYGISPRQLRKQVNKI